MESVEAQIVAKAKELCEALRDAAYTRKDEDKKRVTTAQMELMNLCQTSNAASS